MLKPDEYFRNDKKNYNFSFLTHLDLESKEANFFLIFFNLFADPDPGGQNVADPTHCPTLSEANIYIIIFPFFKHHHEKLNQSSFQNIWYHVNMKRVFVKLLT